MQKIIISACVAVLCMVGGLGTARAEMAYAGGGGGGGSIMQVPNHIDFALMFNHTLDNGDGVKDGGGLWVGYRYSLLEYLSIGGKFGMHSYSIENGNNKDTVTSVPLMFTVQLERNFDHTFNIYGQLGLGPCFNNIRGDLTDAFDLKLDPSIAFDFAFGGTVDITQNVALGLNFDWFLSSAPISANGGYSKDNLNIGHFGIGFIFVGSF